jgi:hypothetical protein
MQSLVFYNAEAKMDTTVSTFPSTPSVAPVVLHKRTQSTQCTHKHQGHNTVFFLNLQFELKETFSKATAFSAALIMDI